MMSEDGTRVFFQSPDPLVGADVNGVPDVYEWENGHVYLISGGNARTSRATTTTAAPAETCSS